jgi:hypothetical protein
MEPASPQPEQTLSDGRPAIAPDGIDLTLIRWMLSLTPAQRLQVLEQNIRSIERLRACRIRD